MQYAKLAGCQNAYVFVPADALGAQSGARLAVRVSRELGSDGLIVWQRDADADVRMIVYNADGSRAKMCGNGIRALAKWVLEQHADWGECLAGPGSLRAIQADPRIAPCRWIGAIVLEESQDDDESNWAVHRLRVATDAGIKRIDALMHGGTMRRAVVDMGIARIIPPDTGSAGAVHACAVAGRQYAFTIVDVGNLHAVVFVADPAAVDIARIGPAIAGHDCLADRANVHFVAVQDRRQLTLRPWERGSGATAACGTGACAGLAAAVADGRAEPRAVVTQPGGDVEVHLEPIAGALDRWRADLIGTAELLATGDWPIATDAV
jgi:diaminopimelate epimerase